MCLKAKAFSPAENIFVVKRIGLIMPVVANNPDAG
jgi:hypothetical protein